MATKFTAKRGVQFAGTDDKGKQVHEPIEFTFDEDLSRDRSADPETGTDRVFSCELDAAGVKALKALGADVLDEYGITEAKKTAKSDDAAAESE